MTLPKNRVHHAKVGRPACPGLDTYVYVEACRRISGKSLNAFVKKFKLTFATAHVPASEWPSTTGAGLRRWIYKYRKDYLVRLGADMTAALERMIEAQIAVLKAHI
jgi:hypothetical protein